MARKYEIGIAADTDGFEKSIKNGLVEPLDEAADKFDDLDRAAKNADLDREIDKSQKAADDLNDELADTRNALKKLGYAAKDAGDDTRRGMDRAEEGVEELGNEAQSTAKEAAASFDGSAESIIDAFQEVAANAFAGFGPAGALAGLAIAAGIGIAVGEFQKAEEAAEELRLKAIEIATAAQDAGVSTETWSRGADRMIERIRELEELKSTDWRWFWEDDPSQLEDWQDALRGMGREVSDIETILRASDDVQRDYLKGLQKSQDALYDEIQLRRESIDLTDEAGTAKTQALIDEYEAGQKVLGYVEDEINLRSEAAESYKRQADAGIEAAQAEAEAQEEKAQRIETAQAAVQDSVTSAYDSMRSSATEFATAEDGALNIDRWLEYTQEHAAAVANYQANLQAMKLTPEQWSNLMEMPEAQRMQWVEQFVAMPENAREPYRAALNDLGSAGGDSATVSFNDSFNPDADVEVNADTSKAAADLKAVTKKRTAEIKVKTTGKAEAKRDLNALAKDRHATIRVRANTTSATNTVNAWRRRQESRPVYITVKARTGGNNLV